MQTLLFQSRFFDELFSFISDDVDKETLLSSSAPPSVQLRTSEKKSLFALLNTLNSADLSDYQQQILYFKRILFEVFTSYFTSFRLTPHEIPHWLKRAVEKMHSPENFLGGTSHFRELCGKSDEHICRSLKKHYNQTPTELINEIKLNYLANMLLTTTLSVTQLCYECGFENASWFFASFKKKYGTTPKEFRKKHSPEKDAHI